jgi:hypothetical protein
MPAQSPIILETFVLRLWWEDSSHAWRGEITHLPGREARHFIAFTQAQDFIESFAPGLSPKVEPGVES